MEVKYDKIGVDYNLTRKADRFLTQKLLNLLTPTKNGIYLDIGCGTGNYTNAFQKKGFQFIGIDPSKKMLQKAKMNNDQIDWKIGSAENTGLSTNAVNGIIGSLTIHHWNDLQSGFLELSRVLKPSGKMVIFTSTPKQMKGYWLNHYFPKMMSDSMEQMPTLKRVETALTNSGFIMNGIDKYVVKPNLEDKFLYCGKQNPEYYFDEHIRSGISSFSSVSNRTEVEKGLSDLRSDIDNGKVYDIMTSYENDLGDYLLIIAKNRQ